MVDFAPDQVAQALRHTYVLLSRLFLEGLTAELIPFAQAIPELAATLPKPFDLDEAAADYQHLFSFNVFPYESIFLDPDGLLGGPITEAVWRSYRQAGYSVAMAASPDHLGQELGLLAFLAGAEANAWADHLPALAQQMQERQRHFLEAHLLRWLPPFVLSVRQQDHPFFTALADLTLALVHTHYAEICLSRETGFQLPTPPPLLDDKHTGLKEIAAYLVTPAYSGGFLSRDGIGRLARQQRLPRGFGGRQQVLVNLMRAAVQYDALPALLADLQTLVGSWQTAYTDLTATFPELSPWLTPWQIQATQTQKLLSQISSQAFSKPLY